MEIILLEKIQNLGELGDEVKVKSGYARNYLIPQRKAVRATKNAKSEVEARRAELLQAANDRLDVARGRALAIEGKSFNIYRKVGEEGKLFGSVSQADIADVLSSNGPDISKSEIHLPEGALKEIGEFEIPVRLHPEVEATIKITVKAEEA